MVAQFRIFWHQQSLWLPQANGMLCDPNAVAPAYARKHRGILAFYIFIIL